ncbi:MAG: adenylyltransferase/cytidyltransferase family protein, partial [Rheinheimera sp.]|nr:adenylyltransferase/cytidyltransferase family protein [Rheinheimera sp.]
SYVLLVVVVFVKFTIWLLALAYWRATAAQYCRLRQHCLGDFGMKRGLTLGKFAPFHRGHQLLIETALAETDEVVVLIYATDVIEVPLQVRAN